MFSPGSSFQILVIYFYKNSPWSQLCCPGISFTPKEVGEHLISVFQAGQHIANSPFRIRISEKEIGDPRRVRVSGPGLISGFANQPNQFTVDTRDAGTLLLRCFYYLFLSIRWLRVFSRSLVLKDSNYLLKLLIIHSGLTIISETRFPGSIWVHQVLSINQLLHISC